VAYHETFWLAVSATAPVIALATTVSIGDMLRLIEPSRMEEKSSSPKVQRGTWPIFWSSGIGFMNMIIQLAFLFAALYSIAKGSDISKSLTLIVWIEPIGIALLVVIAILNAVERIRIRGVRAISTGATPADPDL
jgi:hypothetical protein